MQPFRIPGGRIARAVLATHVVATILLVVVLRHGLPDPATSPADRLEFIRAHGAAWSCGWMLWQIAALSLLGLYAHLALRFWARAPLLVALALVCGAAGFGADVAGQSLYMGMPSLLDVAAQARLEAAAGLITGYAANGLYTFAGVLLTLAGIGELPRRVVAVSIPLWSAGFVLAGASVAHATRLQQLATAGMLGFLFVWTYLLASWLDSAESSS